MIPKKIHYCWFGGNPLPKPAKKCIESWKKYCPDYEIIEWNESNYDFKKNQFMKEAYDAKKWGFVPDYARLDIIYNYGGIYLDTDVEIIKSFDPLLNYSGFAGFERPQSVALGLGFGAEPGNQIVKKLMEDYNNHHFITESGDYLDIAAPKLNTVVLESMGLNCDGSFQLLSGFAFLPKDYLCPKSFHDGLIRKTENTYSIHHFDASWFTDEKQADKIKSWKESKSYERKYYLRYMPNRIAIRILGKKKYNHIKRMIKDKNMH